MGTALGKLFPGAVCVDKDSDEAAWAEFWRCDVIWLAVPRHAIEDVLKTVPAPLQSSQLLIDIFSTKERISERLKPLGAQHLSLHPMHGPNIDPKRQKWFLIGRRDALTGRAHEVVTYLEGLGVRFLEAASEEDHDFKIGVVLGLKEILTLVIDRLIETYADDSNQPRPDIETLFDWSSPVANAMYGAYVHSIRSSEDWLRASLVEGSYGDVKASASKALRALAAELPELNLEKEFEKQRDRVEGAPADVSRYINAWFEGK